VTSTAPAAPLAARHSQCDCLLATQSPVSRFQKDHCTVSVEAATAAVDCDRCTAFTPNQTRPDIILTRHCEQGGLEWLVLELKLTMREHAGPQAAAGLAHLGRHPLFTLNIPTAHIVFVVHRRRRSDQKIMRNIGIITAGPWTVEPTLISSHDLIDCAHPQPDPNHA